jgi:hypothetical protein
MNHWKMGAIKWFKPRHYKSRSSGVGTLSGEVSLHFQVVYMEFVLEANSLHISY